MIPGPGIYIIASGGSKQVIYTLGGNAGTMEDLVPYTSAAIAAIAVLYFLLEFQFTGARDYLAKRLRSLVKR